MITNNKTPGFGGQSAYKCELAFDYRGLSSDEKPLNVTNGSTYLEIDTGKIFCFDRENLRWCAW